MNCIIDLKSGKAESWVALQTAAQSLLDSRDVTFEEEGHIYTLPDGSHPPSITEILKAEGFVDTTFYDEWSRQKGKYVHLAIKYYLAEELDESQLDPEIVPYLNAFKMFLKDSRFEPVSVEVPGYCTTLRYAGTPDLVGKNTTLTCRAALELNNKGKYRLITYTDNNDIAVWRAAVAVYFWKQNNLKRRK